MHHARGRRRGAFNLTHQPGLILTYQPGLYHSVAISFFSVSSVVKRQQWCNSTSPVDTYYV